jgi:hypothetical protein
MKHVKIFGLALVAMAALGVASASSALAALLFHSSATGTLLAKLVGAAHKFKTSAGTVECTSANGEGAITEKLAEVQLVLVTYANCTVTEPIKSGATVSPADYLFNANGTVKLDNTVTIKPSPEICKITVGPQSLTGITYANIAGPPMEIEVKANVSAIHYSISGGAGFCGAEGAHTDGTYSGTEKAKEDGGEILVD